MKILVAMPSGVTKDTFFPEKVLKHLETLGEVEHNTLGRQYTEEEFKEALKDKEICITGWGTPPLTSAVLEKAYKLKALLHTGGSVANVATKELYEKKVRVLSGNQLYAESVAEGVIAYMLCSLRELIFYNGEVKSGGWRAGDFKNEGLLDQSVGLVGFGAVTRSLIKLLKPFRCKIKVFSNSATQEALEEYGVEKAELKEIFSECKLISLHSPYRKDTHHMINKEMLDLINPGSILINTARGGIVDEEALIEALERKTFKAVLDVYEQEPLPEGSKLRSLDNVITIPHMAGPTVDRRAKVTEALLESIGYLDSPEVLPLEIKHSHALLMTKE
ncbi:MAG: hydroxyacid dehydrogenase [Clostridiaceae bacterium]